MATQDIFHSVKEEAFMAITFGLHTDVEQSFNGSGGYLVPGHVFALCPGFGAPSWAVALPGGEPQSVHWVLPILGL